MRMSSAFTCAYVRAGVPYICSFASGDTSFLQLPVSEDLRVLRHELAFLAPATLPWLFSAWAEGS